MYDTFFSGFIQSAYGLLRGGTSFIQIFGFDGLASLFYVSPGSAEKVPVAQTTLFILFVSLYRGFYVRQKCILQNQPRLRGVILLDSVGFVQFYTFLGISFLE